MDNISGICLYKGCKNSAVMNGYCPTHYRIISEQQQKDLTLKMLTTLELMNRRLENLENLMSVNNQTVQQQTTQQQNIQQLNQNNSNKSTIQRPSSMFIPTIEQPKITNVFGLQTDTQEKDPIKIAEKLRNQTES